jgi:hypothetical protein
VIIASRSILVSTPHMISRVTKKGMIFKNFICIFILIIFSFFFVERGDYEAIVVAGDDEKDSKDGTVAECSFDSPRGLAVDEKTHTCFVAEYKHSKIRKIAFVD